MINTIGRRGLPRLLIATFAPLLLLAAGAGQASVCDGFYSAGFKLAEGKLNPPMASRSKPAKGVATSEANFSTCLFRATDHRTEPSSIYARNDYSRRQAFNANNTYFLTYSNNGSWHLYDANSLEHLRVLTPLAADAEPQWHPTDPNTLYYLPTNGGTKLLKVDVRNNNSSTVVDFKGKLPAWANSAAHIWTHSEGAPSANGRYWGFLVQDNDWNVLGYIVWDLQKNKLIGSRQASSDADNASISASGRWFVTNDNNGVWAWSNDFTRKKKIDAYGGIHSDLAIGPNGNDYFVSVDYESDDGEVYFVDLDSCPSVSASVTSAPECPRTALFSMYTIGAWATFHFSGKAFDKPGWVLISSYDSQSNRGVDPWFNNKVFAIELKASPKIYMLAYTRRVRPNDTYGESGADAYWTEPHATVNRDFTRVSFNSNWGNREGADVDVYTVVLPANALGGTAPPPRIPVTGGILPPEMESETGASSSNRQRVPASVRPTSATGGTVSIGCVVCARLGQARKAMAAFAGYLWHEAEPVLRSAVRSLDFGSDEPVPAVETPAITRKVRAAESAATAASSEAVDEGVDTAPKKTTAAGTTKAAASATAAAVACSRDVVAAATPGRAPDVLSAANDGCGKHSDRQRLIR